MFQVHNLTTATDSWCGTYKTREEADAVRNTWAEVWPTNTYLVRPT